MSSSTQPALSVNRIYELTIRHMLLERIEAPTLSLVLADFEYGMNDENDGLFGMVNMADGHHDGEGRDDGGTVEQLEAILAGSAEYFQNQAGGTNDGFIIALYQDALNRAADPGGRVAFDQALMNGATRAQIAAMIFGSQEFQQDLVQGFYQQLLRRAADSDGLSADLSAL
jgi:hypothetical protein